MKTTLNTKQARNAGKFVTGAINRRIVLPILANAEMELQFIDELSPVKIVSGETMTAVIMPMRLS